MPLTTEQLEEAREIFNEERRLHDCGMVITRDKEKFVKILAAYVEAGIPQFDVRTPWFPGSEFFMVTTEEMWRHPVALEKIDAIRKQFE